MSKTDANLLHLIHEFFSTCKTYDLAMQFLKSNRNCKFYEYTHVSSRKILLSLLIYQFGKEIDYPDELISKARQMILFILRERDVQAKEQGQGRSQESQEQGQVKERRKVIREFLEEFDKYKKEDLRKYMYELGVEYAQLQDIKDRLKEGEDDDIWKEQIEILQKKILEYVHHSNGYDEFQKCLSSLQSIKNQIIEQCMEHAYWDILKQDLEEKRYDLLLKNFTEIKNMLLEMHEDEDTKEIMDEKYLQQLLTNDLFDDRAFIGQIEFIYGKMKKYGIPIYDPLIEKTKLSLIHEIKEKGLSTDIIVKTFQKTLPMLKFYIDIIKIYRKKIVDLSTKLPQS